MRIELSTLQEVMAQKTDDELIVLVTAKAAEYRPAALEVAREELGRRGIEAPRPEATAESQARVEAERLRRMSSHWVNYYAVICCLFCAPFLPKFFPSLTNPSAATLQGLIFMILALPVAVGVVAIACGLFLRRLWAWKLNWICIGGWVLLTAMVGYPNFVVGAIEGLVWSIPNFFYFKKRRHMFS